MGRLSGKIAFVTGAARGIGKGIALCLAEEGADIIINDLDPAVRRGAADAAEVKAEVERMGRKAHIAYADVTDREGLSAAMRAGIDYFGKIDIAVANAASSIREPVIEAKWDHVLKTIEVAQFGVFHTCQFAAQHMVERIKSGTPGGKIIITGSILSEIPFPTSAAYNMAKAAVTHFCRTLSAELAQYRINVNIIHPGYTDTPGERNFATEEQLQAAARALPWGRLGTPRDIGKAAAYLASDDADYVTGSSLVVDGGYRWGMRMPEPDESK